MKQLTKIILTALLVGLLALTAGCGSDSSNHSTTSDQPTDKVALAGETSGKLFFDINLGDADKLALYLNVIDQTYQGLEAQDVEPMVVIAFRGAAVTLVTETAADSLKAQIAALAALPNVRFEACSVATALFEVDNATILPQITVVGNTFISSLGFQAQGYAPILVQ